jgi:catechol 2,3-dioxygenase
MNEHTSTIKGLGEIAIRVRNLEAMQEFYEKIIGLELLGRYEDVIVFFRIAPGQEGHTQLLALFDQSAGADHPSSHYTGVDPQKSTLHHLAFTISLSDYEAEKKRLQHLGLDVKTSEHGWAHYRSLFIADPEGNVVEFVCYDANVQ